MLDLIREIAQTLRNNKLRTFLTGFAVAWGIFMLIILLGMARGVTNAFQANSSEESSKRLSVWSGYTSKPFRGYKEGRQITPEVSDLDQLRANLPETVEDVSSYKMLGNANFASARDYVSINPQGVYPAELVNDRITMSHGRFINDMDLREKRKVIVLTEENARTLFGDPESAVGQRVSGLGLSWLVVGIYNHDWRSDTYIPFTTAMALSEDNRKLGSLQIQLRDIKSEDDANAAENAVRKQLAANHSFAEDDKSALFIYNRFSSYLQQSAAFNILNVSIWVIGIFTLLSGIVGVSNIMFVSVRERTHEIGIRRAIGAKPRSILLQIVTESVAITTLFGYIGIVLGMAIMQLVATMTKGAEFMSNPTIDLSIAVEVTILLIIAGGLAGLFPALKATKVKPVEALRDE